MLLRFMSRADSADLAEATKTPSLLWHRLFDLVVSQTVGRLPLRPRHLVAPA
jgi:hypothetical protein